MKFLLFLTLLASSAFAVDRASIVNWPIPPLPPGANPATFAAPRNEWMQKFDANLRLAEAGNIDLLFEGDSITEWWNRAGSPVWQRHYGSLRAASFGIGGDRTETVLWRIQQGQLDGLSPRLIVLMIGTNNSGRDRAEQIVEGITSLVREIRLRCPSSHLLLLGIFPRAENPEHPLRLKVAEVNRQLAAVCWERDITFLDIGAVFLSDDGTLSRDVMPDFLHLSEKGYALWAEAIRPHVERHLTSAP